MYALPTRRNTHNYDYKDGGDNDDVHNNDKNGGDNKRTADT